MIKDYQCERDAIRYELFSRITREHTECVEIGGCLSYEQPTTYLVQSTEYSVDPSLTPVLTANKSFVLGYTDEDCGIYTKGECIVFDDFTMDLKYVDFSFKVKSSAIKILTAKGDTNLYFMYELLCFLSLSSEEHKRHYIAEVANIPIPKVSLEKQHLIANTLRTFKNKIEIEENLMKHLCLQHSYLLQQMFI